MTHYDFSPLFRTTVGFDRMAQVLDALAGQDTAPGYPPYNIEKIDEDRYQITLAIPGFNEDSIKVELRENTLLVTATPGDDPTEQRHFLHIGINRRPFECSFQLADYVTVVDATLDQGMLRIDLQRELPEQMKPRKIEISSRSPKARITKMAKLTEGSRTGA
jgi:molecular chaperone IbpA